MRRFWFFPVLVLLMIILSLFVFTNFTDTKEKIKNDIFQESLKNVYFVSKHISKFINKNFDIERLKISPKIKTKVDEYLNSFITPNYKNIFMLYPEGNFFVALADGSEVDRFDFREKFEPLHKSQWIKVLNTKKPLYFKQNIKDIWTTYLYPVMDKDNNIKYILVVDFSTKPVELVENSLSILKGNVEVFIATILISVIVLVMFIIYDFKRQKQLTNLIFQLKELNNTLEEKVKEELEKNAQKDRQLELQSRMALMGELLSMIAHQWRQPLNTLGGIVSNLKLDLVLDTFNKENLKNTLDKIENIILHLSTTIDDFRKFYREDNHLIKTKVSKIIEDSVNIVLPSLKVHNIELLIDIKDDCEINTMPNRIKQVLLNIIKNASDVLIERKIEKPYVKITTIKKENCVILIQDNGGGIKDNILDKIFDPYFTTKDLKNGTGLGLYMSKMIIEKLNASLEVYNDENGAVFKIELKEIDEN